MEQQILNEIKSDREKGAAFLLEEYAGLLWSVCAKRLQNEEDIKECVNGVFAEFCLNPEKYDSAKGSLKNYLCQIADKRAIDIYRKNLRNQKITEASVAQKKAEQESLTKQQEETELLEEALEKLEPIDSQILRMKYYDGMTYEEIAKMLGMTHESVKKRGLRGRKKLLYILLVGLIVAVLAACAAVIFRKYQFSPSIGFFWTEQPAYELAEEGFSVEIDDVVLKLDDAIYCDNKLELQFYLGWQDEEKEDHSGLIEKAGELRDGRIFLYDEYDNKVKYGGAFSTVNTYEVGMTNKQISFLMEYEKLDLKRNKDGERILLAVIIDEEHRFDVPLRELPMLEMEEPTNGITMSDGSKILFGKGYVGDDNLSIVNLYHKGANEYVVTELITATFMGEHGKEHMPLYLTDEAGNTYEMFRGMGEDVNQMGLRREYNLYFMDAEPGSYTLHIPRICVQKEMSTGKVTLELPVEEEEMSCDEEILFPDGTGFRITEIRREYHEKIGVNYDKYGNYEGETVVPQYLYYLEYEPIIPGELEYLVADVQGENVKLGIVKGEYYLKIDGEEPLDKVEVEFVNPYYMIHESYEVNIEIETLAE